MYLKTSPNQQTFYAIDIHFDLIFLLFHKYMYIYMVSKSPPPPSCDHNSIIPRLLTSITSTLNNFWYALPIKSKAIKNVPLILSHF